MQGQWWLSSPFLLPALTLVFPGPWATGRLGPAYHSLFPQNWCLYPFETYIIEVTLITDTVKLLVPPWWSGWIRMSCDWLCMNLPELTSFDAQVKSAQDNMLLPSGYLYPDLDGGIICYFVLQPPYHRGNDGWGDSAGKHVMTLHGIDLRSEQPCYMREIQLGFHSTQLSSTIGFLKLRDYSSFKIYDTLWHGQLICIIC